LRGGDELTVAVSLSIDQGTSDGCDVCRDAIAAHEK